MKIINWIKNNKKSIFAFFLGTVLFSLITVFVAIVVESNKITEAKAECPEGSICYTPVSFAEDDWITIAEAVRSGDYPYQVGDKKNIDMGDFGTHVLRVANTTSCINGETSETACGFVVEFTDSITYYNMNTTNSNVGGWRDSAMRTYVNKDIYNALPSDLQSVISTTKVISGHGSTEGETNFQTFDKLYLLNTREVFGFRYEEFDTSIETSRQLDYYKNSGDTYKGDNKIPSGWWLRSATSFTSTGFLLIDNKGMLGYYDNMLLASIFAQTSFEVSPAFRIA